MHPTAPSPGTPMPPRFTDEQLQRIAERLLDDLLHQNAAQLKGERRRVLARIVTTLRANLAQEQDLDADARALLEAHLKQAPPGVDRQKLFLMIKKKLAEERGIPL